MTMHELPIRAILAVDFSHAQRPVLSRQPAHLGPLVFDHDENDELVRCIGLQNLEFGFAFPEVSR